MAVKFIEPGMDATQDGAFFAGLNASGGTVAYDSSQSHDGPGSIKCNITAGGQWASPFTPDGAVADAGSCASAWYRFSTVTPATLTNFMLTATSNNGSGRIGLGLNTNGTILFCNVGSTAVSGSTVLSANTWYRISISYTNVSVSTWAAKVYINGVLEINASAGGQGNSSGNGGVCVSFGQNATSVGGMGTSAVSTIWVDSIYVDNRTDLTDCGDIRVTAKRPNANGTSNGFTTQIGAGGSGYGTGHSPQVNERPQSDTNGWSISTAAKQTEEYNIEGKATGDIDISAATIVDYMGWIRAKEASTSNSPVAHIIVNGVATAKTLTIAAAYYTQIAGSATYPAGTGTDIGMDGQYTTTAHLYSLLECGIVVAYTPTTVVNASIAQVAAALTFTGGTQVVATVNNVAVAQAAATITLTGGSQATQVAVAQSAATVTLSGGTQSVATVNDVSIAQSAATLTLIGSTQAVFTVNNVSITQIGATLTLTGGTQVVAAVRNVSITQVSVTLTLAGGTQAIATVNKVAISQTTATLTLAGGSQGVQDVQDVQIAQVAATITVTGGTQGVSAGAGAVNASVTQLAGMVTATGGTQTVATVNNVSISQVSATLIMADGTQAVASIQDVAVSQVAAVITLSGATARIAIIDYWPKGNGSGSAVWVPGNDPLSTIEAAGNGVPSVAFMPGSTPSGSVGSGNGVSPATWTGGNHV